MNIFHTVNTIQDEQRLLERIVDVETRIRAQQEQKRLRNKGQSEKYSKIFEPITKQLKDPD